MKHRLEAALLTGMLGLLMALAASAQAGSATGVLDAPDYGSGASAGALSAGNFNTPEADGRPGAKYFAYGVQAFRKGDYRHAIDMYKVAASWAYKPAEYNLAVMYFKGQGVPVNRPLGAAWMVLAAERGNPRYVKARDLMVTVLSKAQFAKTDALWGQLRQTYGDKVALRRAKAQWAWVKTHQTGTRVGGTVGELHVGATNKPIARNQPGRMGKAAVSAAGWGLLAGGSIDGSVAYRQFRQSDNPYDPVFLKHRTGTVSVEPLQPVKPAARKSKKGATTDRGSVSGGPSSRGP